MSKSKEFYEQFGELEIHTTPVPPRKMKTLSPATKALLKLQVGEWFICPKELVSGLYGASYSSGIKIRTGLSEQGIVVERIE